MQFKKLHNIILVGLFFISSILCSQVPKEAEENNLKFQTYFFEALKQKAIKNYSKAIENLEKCYEIKEQDMAVEFELSKNYLFLNQFFEAELFINKALETSPSNQFLLQHKVLVYKSQRKFSEAIEIQKKLNEIHPKYADELALLYIQNKNYIEAENLIAEIEKNALTTRRISSFKAYIENRKKAIASKNNVSTSKSTSQTIDDLRKEFQDRKGYKTLIHLLNKEIELEKYELLNSDSKKGIELYPAQPVLYKLNGLALNKIGKYNKAIIVLTIGMDFVIDNKVLEADFYSLIAVSYEKLNNTKKASNYKQKAAALRKVTK